MAGITKKQIRVIWAIWKKRIGLGSEDLYELLRNAYGVERMHELSYWQAEDLIRALREQVGDEVPGMATYRQKVAILNKMKRLGWNEGSLRKFMERVVGKSHIKWLSAEDARKVLAGMERIEVWNMRLELQRRRPDLMWGEIKRMKRKELEEKLRDLGKGEDSIPLDPPSKEGGIERGGPLLSPPPQAGEEEKRERFPQAGEEAVALPSIPSRKREGRRKGE